MKNNYSILSPYFKSIGIIFILLIFSFITTIGQIPQTDFRLQKLNNLYVGVDNPLDIVSMNEFDSISFSNGTIIPNKFSPTKSMSFLITPDKVDNSGESKVTIYLNGNPLDEMNYRSILTPLPKVQFARKSNRATFCVECNLEAVMKDFDYDVHFEIISFDLVVIINGEQIMLTSNSNKLTHQQKAILYQLTTGDTVFLENIKVTGPGGIRSAEPIKVVVQ
ncbi:MAG: hypothetical protein K9H26_03700 [Prolixibacteraceae bacterium]|nr:hypothetical protein [Prolixibacteraceae bacterium]